MNEFLENLKRDAEANPMIALGLAAGLLTAAGKFIEALGSVPSKRAYAKKFGNPKKAKS
ncbi:MAG TPA: hypothetical protein VN843_14905 [Anaerolineales bacterium]|nr:hypothetical protein [Anaerolineales bacterium]